MNQSDVSRRAFVGSMGVGATLSALSRPALAAKGPTVIEAVVDSEHYIDTVYD